MSSLFKSRTLRLLLVSPPGGGKGTIINKIVESKPDFLGYKEVSLKVKGKEKNELIPNEPLILSSGTILRNGQEDELIKKFMSQGKLVPDSAINSLMMKTLKDVKIENSTTGNNMVILDGFPRNKQQCVYLKDNMDHDKQIDMVIEIDTPQKLIIDRCVQRFIHLKSGRTYNMKYKPPKVSMKDDVTGEPLIQRDDDKYETVTMRLEDYNKKLIGIKEFFLEDTPRENILYYKVDGETSDLNFKEIMKILENYFKTKEQEDFFKKKF
ncbi:hypothetical protein QEN19_000906 [Hanseniaspora menglaensis]